LLGGEGGKERLKPNTIKPRRKKGVNFTTRENTPVRRGQDGKKKGRRIEKEESAILRENSNRRACKGDSPNSGAASLKKKRGEKRGSQDLRSRKGEKEKERLEAHVTGMREGGSTGPRIRGGEDPNWACKKRFKIAKHPRQGVFKHAPF